MKAKRLRRTDVAFRFAPVTVALAGLLGFIGHASAFVIPSENPDIAMSWDQTLRYNAAWRLKDRDPGLSNNLAYDEGDYKFGKHDMTTNRIDLFSEFDLKYKEDLGLRISGEAWFDSRYGSRSKALPGTTLAQQNIKGTFNNETQRFYRGPSGEFLDYFVWGSTKIGETRLLGRLGSHSAIWGESLIGNAQAVSYAQQPNDNRKSQQSPGASAKETALPVNQFTGNWQFLDNASLHWQYQFQWKPNRFSLGGTYFGADAFSDYVAGTVPRVDAEEGKKGAWGLMLKGRPDFLDADIGLVYRKFDETNPWAAQLNFAPLNGRFVYARNVELWGLTFNKVIFDMAVGAEISHRKNMALNTNSSVSAGPAGRFEGPIGNTWHGILNFTWTVGQTNFFDTAALIGELQYSRLDKVTKNAGFYKSSSNSLATACINGRDQILNSCSTKDFLNLGLIFSPQWLQVYPGLDLAAPVVYVIGLKGNAPANSGGNEGSGSFKISLVGDYRVKHKVELGYNKFLGKKRYGVAGSSNPPSLSGGLPVKYTVGAGAFGDRDWLNLTYTYNF